MCLRFQFIGNCIILFAAIFAVGAKDTLSAGIVGLSISYAMQVVHDLNASVRLISEFEAHLVAVERVQEYIELDDEVSVVFKINIAKWHKSVM